MDLANSLAGPKSGRNSVFLARGTGESGLLEGHCFLVEKNLKSRGLRRGHLFSMYDLALAQDPLLGSACVKQSQRSMAKALGTGLRNNP